MKTDAHVLTCRSWMVLLFAMIVCGRGTAEVTVLPSEGKAVGVATSDKPGGWFVFYATKSVPVNPVKVTVLATDGGGTRCMWEGDPTTYVVLLFRTTDGVITVDQAVVTLGGGKKPDPDPDPDPGARRVVVLAEQTQNTAPREVALKTVRDYVRDKHGANGWRLYDPNQTDSTGQTPAWLRTMLDDAQEVGLPALLVYADAKLVKASPFPSPGGTAASGQAAGEQAIRVVKEAGG